VHLARMLLRLLGEWFARGWQALRRLRDRGTWNAEAERVTLRRADGTLAAEVRWDEICNCTTESGKKDTLTVWTDHAQHEIPLQGFALADAAESTEGCDPGTPNVGRMVYEYYLGLLAHKSAEPLPQGFTYPSQVREGILRACLGTLAGVLVTLLFTGGQYAWPYLSDPDRLRKLLDELLALSPGTGLLTAGIVVMLGLQLIAPFHQLAQKLRTARTQSIVVEDAGLRILYQNGAEEWIPFAEITALKIQYPIVIKTEKKTYTFDPSLCFHQLFALLVERGVQRLHPEMLEVSPRGSSCMRWLFLLALVIIVVFLWLGPERIWKWFR